MVMKCRRGLTRGSYIEVDEGEKWWGWNEVVMGMQNKYGMGRMEGWSVGMIIPINV